MSFIVTNKVNVYEIDENTIPYSGIYVIPKSNLDLSVAKEILESEEFLDYVKDELGFKVLPVIQVPKHLGIENISGFRPNSIKELSKVC